MLFGDLDPVVRPFINAILIGLGWAILAFVASQVLGCLLIRPMEATWGCFVAGLVKVLIVVLWLKPRFVLLTHNSLVLK